MFSYRTLIFTLSIVLLGGALYWRMARAEGEEAPKAGAEEKAPAPPKDLDQMIDEVPRGALEDGVVMQAEDIKVTLASVEKAEKGFIDSKKKTDPQFEVKDEFQGYMRRQFAFRFFANQLVEKYARDNKIEVPKEQFETNFANFKKAQEARGGNYEEWLTNTGMSDEEFRKIWGLNWALEQKVQSSIKDEDVTRRYDDMKEQLANAPLRRASHILYMYKGGQAGDKATRSKEEAKAAAEATLKKVKEGGDFAALAKESSDCPSGKQAGGDLDFFPRQGAMVEPFAEATYKLAKVGHVTDVVETPFGFHIIKLTELRDEKWIKDQIRMQLSGEKFNMQMQQIIESGLAKAKFNEKLVPEKKAPAPPAPAPAPVAPKPESPKTE
ncbi:MAG TPA: peptidylprolyl isomerase [Planctomycetota bacterium]|nr:peptidylprolyl isomerase [Planctomycetota bacterium]